MFYFVENKYYDFFLHNDALTYHNCSFCLRCGVKCCVFLTASYCRRYILPRSNQGEGEEVEREQGNGEVTTECIAEKELPCFFSVSWNRFRFQLLTASSYRFCILLRMGPREKEKKFRQRINLLCFAAGLGSNHLQ